MPIHRRGAKLRSGTDIAPVTAPNVSPSPYPRSSIMERNKAIALLLLVVAVLLPPHWTAAALAGSSPHLASVQMGVWIVKATLALHALILALASRLPLGTDGASAESPPAIASSGSRMMLAGLLIIGLALRLHDLGVGLWFDEIQTMVDYVRLPLGQILSTYDSQNQHMLYSVLARLSVDLFGDSGWSLRLPAALMGTASLWATYRLASRLTSEREALLATLLLTVSYHHVWFSQNARGYSGLLLFSLLGTEAFLRLTGPSQAGWKTAVFYATCMALAIYTHVTAAFVVVAHAVIALVIWWRQGRSLTTPVRRALAGIILTGTFSLQLYALVLPQFFDTLLTPTMAGTDTAWKDPLWLLTETLNGLARGLPGGWIVLVGGLVVAVCIGAFAGVQAGGSAQSVPERAAIPIERSVAPARKIGGCGSCNACGNSSKSPSILTRKCWPR